MLQEFLGAACWRLGLFFLMKVFPLVILPKPEDDDSPVHIIIFCTDEFHFEQYKHKIRTETEED